MINDMIYGMTFISLILVTLQKVNSPEQVLPVSGKWLVAIRPITEGDIGKGQNCMRCIIQI